MEGAGWEQKASGERGCKGCTQPGTSEAWESARLPLLDYLFSTVLL